MHSLCLLLIQEFVQALPLRTAWRRKTTASGEDLSPLGQARKSLPPALLHLHHLRAGCIIYAPEQSLCHIAWDCHRRVFSTDAASSTPTRCAKLRGCGRIKSKTSRRTCVQHPQSAPECIRDILVWPKASKTPLKRPKVSETLLEAEADTSYSRWSRPTGLPSTIPGELCHLTSEACKPAAPRSLASKVGGKSAHACGGASSPTKGVSRGQQSIKFRASETH